MLDQNDIKTISDIMDKKFDIMDKKLDTKLQVFRDDIDEKLTVFRDEIIDGVGEILDRHDQEIEQLKTNSVTKSQLKVAIDDLERKLA